MPLGPATTVERFLIRRGKPVVEVDKSRSGELKMSVIESECEDWEGLGRSKSLKTNDDELFDDVDLELLCRSPKPAMR